VDDAELLQRLLAGDERAFAQLVARYHQTLVSIARYYVNSDASAEDVAQDTWIAVLRGVDRFEGRSSFKTWLLRILVNRARTTGTKEHRSIPVDPTANTGSDLARRFDEGGAWREPVAPFTDAIEDAIVNERVVRLVRASIAALGEPQQAVVTLRDVEGLSTAEVAELLELSEANVRVILHRARSKVRADVEASLRGGG
jgi:RNA polymerase sigma-70 factor (ECF subfamily)